MKIIFQIYFKKIAKKIIFQKNSQENSNLQKDQIPEIVRVLKQAGVPVEIHFDTNATEDCYKLIINGVVFKTWPVTQNFIPLTAETILKAYAEIKTAADPDREDILSFEEFEKLETDLQKLSDTYRTQLNNTVEHLENAYDSTVAALNLKYDQKVLETRYQPAMVELIQTIQITAATMSSKGFSTEIEDILNDHGYTHLIVILDAIRMLAVLI